MAVGAVVRAGAKVGAAVALTTEVGAVVVLVGSSSPQLKQNGPGGDANKFGLSFRGQAEPEKTFVTTVVSFRRSPQGQRSWEKMVA